MQACWRNRLFLVFPLASDLVFLLLYGFFMAAVLDRVLMYLVAAGALGVRSSASLTVDSSTLLGGIISQSGSEGLIFGALLLLCVLAMAVFLSYAVLQGIGWFCASQLSGMKMEFLRFIRRFTLASLPWYIMFLLVLVLYYWLRFRDFASTRIYQTDSTGFLFIPYVLFVLIGISTIVAYAVLDMPGVWAQIKRAVSELVKKPLAVLFPVLIAAVSLYVVNRVFGSVFEKLVVELGVPFALGIAVFALLMLPLVTFFRVYLLRSIRSEIS